MASRILRGANGIAEHTGLVEREVRHLLDKHGLPHVRHGRAIFANSDEVDRYFSSRWRSEQSREQKDVDLVSVSATQKNPVGSGAVSLKKKNNKQNSST